MKYIDLFAGIGGFRYGIEQAFNDKYSQGVQQRIGHSNSTNTMKSLVASKPLCVYSNEWDKYANGVYRRNYGDCDGRDIRSVEASDVPDHDLLCAGFPCQAFSVAGKRGGFSDTRGTLFFEIARIAKEKRPRLLLLENVKGLLNHDQGRTFGTILNALDELGYDVQWQVCNSKDFGVPQNRERVYIVGHLRGTPRPEVFPITKNFEKLNSTEQKENKPFLPTMLSEHRTNLGKQTRREIKKQTGKDSTLRGKDHKEYRPNNHQLANCLTTGKDNVEKWLIESGLGIRRLTPVECERLQGFPDNWTKFGINSTLMSDTQRYKMCGNAVTTNVIKMIAEKLLLD